MVLKTASEASSIQSTPASTSYSLQDYLTLLESQNEDERRLAARSLSKYPVATPALLNALAREKSVRVNVTILVSLQCIGGHRVLEGLLPYLRSDNGILKNGVIEILQGMPKGISMYVHKLISDPEPDVRILALDILQTIEHPDTSKWLHKVIVQDNHVNVVATAIDRLSELGNAKYKPIIEGAKKRFPKEAYIDFVVNLAIKRLSKENSK